MKPDAESLLLPLRAKIDDLDFKLLKILNQRATLVKKIGHHKLKQGLKIRVLKREKQILNQLKTLNKGPLLKAELAQIFNLIFKIMRQIESPSRKKPE